MFDHMKGYIDYYGNLVRPSEEEILEFLKREIGTLSSAHILDAACGRGEIAHALAVEGAVVTAIENEQALLKQARAYALTDKVPRALQFQAAPLLDLPGQAGSYHILLCLHNACSVLKNEREYAQFFQKAAQLLNKGGRLVVQLFNYDLILDYQMSELPDLTDEENGVRLKRKLKLRNDGMLAMDTVLSVMRIDAKELSRQQIVIYPIRKVLLQKLLQEAGFAVIDYFSGPDSAPWQEDSPSTLLVAIRS